MPFNRSSASQVFGAGYVRRVAGAFGCLMLSFFMLRPALAAVAPPASLQVLHWWTSASERKAANLLAAYAAADNITWMDSAIPGGAGLAAVKVLRSLVLANNAPEVTQIIGASIGEWAALGMLLELDAPAQAGNWNTVLFPAIYKLVQHRQHVVAAPIGIHRINTLFYNRALFARLKLKPPKSWSEFEQMAHKFKDEGIAPLALSSEPWQVATLFENLLLASGGQQLHRELFVRMNAQALSDPRLTEALERLRVMKSWARQPIVERNWTEVVQQLANGEAAMLVMGDWAKGELNVTGLPTDGLFSCSAMPGTEKFHLYSVDTLTMFAKDYAHSPAQEKLARLLLTPVVQTDYNNVKGSVSVRRDADPARMDSCARASWTAFGLGAPAQVPSLVHRMSVDEVARDAVIAEINHFFANDSVTPAQARQRLGAVFRALHLRRSDP
jgi:glucose/mannose transport system substrate-binding protein